MWEFCGPAMRRQVGHDIGDATAHPSEGMNSGAGGVAPHRRCSRLRDQSHFLGIAQHALGGFRPLRAFGQRSYEPPHLGLVHAVDGPCHGGEERSAHGNGPAHHGEDTIGATGIDPFGLRRVGPRSRGPDAYACVRGPTSPGVGLRRVDVLSEVIGSDRSDVSRRARSRSGDTSPAPCTEAVAGGESCGRPAARRLERNAR